VREVGGPVPRSSNAVGARLIFTSLTDILLCCCYIGLLCGCVLFVFWCSVFRKGGLFVSVRLFPFDSTDVNNFSSPLESLSLQILLPWLINKTLHVAGSTRQGRAQLRRDFVGLCLDGTFIVWSN